MNELAIFNKIKWLISYSYNMFKILKNLIIMLIKKYDIIRRHLMCIKPSI